MLKFRFYFFQLIACIVPFCATAGFKVKDSATVFNSLDSLYKIEGENNPSKGLSISQRQLEIAKLLANDTLIVKAGINKAECLAILGVLDRSLSAYFDALHIAERVNEVAFEAKILYRMGMVYQTLGDYKQSNEFLERSKALYIRSHHGSDTIIANYELGFNCLATQEHQKGISIIENNLKAAKQINDQTKIVLGLDNLSNIYFDMGKNEQSLAYLLDMLNYPEGFQSNYRKTAVNEHIAELYVAMKQWTPARKYLAETFKYATAINSNDWLFEYYKLLAVVEESTGNFKKALDAHKTYLALKDSVFRKEYDNKIAAMTSVYELDKKQNQITLLEKDKAIAVEKLRQRVWQRNAIIVSSVLLLALIVSGLLTWLQRKTKNMQIAFSRSLISNQEAERQRISRELHDSVGQNILFIKNQLARQPASEQLAPVMEAIAATIDDVRNLSKDLYPNQLEKYGLAAAVDALAEKVSEATGIFVSSDLEEIEPLLSKEAKINFYRVIQECINNVIKHAGAKAVRITGEHTGSKILLTIIDNGKGFDKKILEEKAQRSFGLLNMEERAKMLNGKMDLETSDAGTKITITIPKNHEV